MEYFKKDFLVKKRGILCKMNPKNQNGKKEKNIKQKEKKTNSKERKK